jgi:AraC-like DNA-binding protein
MEKNERENLVQNVIDFICFCDLETFSQITQKGLADKFNTSPEHLSRAFKRETDQTFQEFLIGVKMNRSFKLLWKKPNLTVREVAEDMGYNSTSHFVQAFKKYHRLTPRELQRRMSRRFSKKSDKKMSKT